MAPPDDRHNQFEFKTVDKEGMDILNAISAADKFNRWMYEQITPYCNGKILEIGSGLGNISNFFLKDKKDIVLSDIRPNYREYLIKNFQLNEKKVIELNLVEDNFQITHQSLLSQFDCVFALNVVEHIERDSSALANMYSLLKPGGTLIILVPAHQSLYNGIDKALEHYRRYSKDSLMRLMQQTGHVEKLFFFNAAGIPAWWIGGKVLRQNTIPEGEMRLYNFFVPVFKLIDKIVGHKIGLSVIGVMRKR